MTKDLAPPELLRKLLRYEPETGKLFWRKRTPDLFKSTRACNAWNAKHAGKEAFAAVNGRGYWHSCVFGRLYRAHRVAWAMHYGAWPKNQIDHIDGNKLNNRIANLRDVSRQENNRNAKRPKNNTSGVVGVCWDKSAGKWHARIKVDQVHITLGVFRDFDKAVATRKAAEKKYGFHKNHGRG